MPSKVFRLQKISQGFNHSTQKPYKKLLPFSQDECATNAFQLFFVFFLVGGQRAQNASCYATFKFQPYQPTFISEEKNPTGIIKEICSLITTFRINVLRFKL